MKVSIYFFLLLNIGFKHIHLTFNLPKELQRVKYSNSLFSFSSIFSRGECFRSRVFMFHIPVNAFNFLHICSECPVVLRYTQRNCIFLWNNKNTGKKYEKKLDDDNICILKKLQHPIKVQSTF